jgi:hypothetical protein
LTSTDTLAEIQRHKTALNTAEEDLVASVRTGIKQGLVEAFENSDVENVLFGVSAQPYNDENVGMGTYGPAVNSVENPDDLGYHILSDLSYGGRISDHRVKLLADVLNAGGWKYAALALGVGYYENEGSGGEVAYVAVRDHDAPGGYLLTEHDQAY